MSKLLLFYPEHDLALAAGNSNYTAPAAALKLRRAGMALPLWLGSTGDMVCTGALPAEWYERVQAIFNLHAQPYDHSRRPELEAAPWGWSIPACKTLVEQGFDPSRLPGREQLEAIRQLSHRRTSARLHQMLSDRLSFDILPGAQEVTDLSVATAFRRGATDVPTSPIAPRRDAVATDLIAKAPWSSSGRGLLDSRFYPTEDFIRFASGMVRRQGSVMIEPAYERVLDFALLYEADGHGGCAFAGHSVFETEGQGQYKANILASDSVLRDRIAAYVGEAHLAELTVAVGECLGRLTDGIYRGPLGVDMLIARLPDAADGEAVTATQLTDGYALHATVEINFRSTMGLVARRLYDNYIRSGSEGRFYIRPEQPTDSQLLDACTISDHRLVAGTLILNPPATGLSFVAEVG